MNIVEYVNAEKSGIQPNVHVHLKPMEYKRVGSVGKNTIIFIKCIPDRMFIQIDKDIRLKTYDNNVIGTYTKFHLPFKH